MLIPAFTNTLFKSKVSNLIKSNKWNLIVKCYLFYIYIVFLKFQFLFLAGIVYFISPNVCIISSNENVLVNDLLVNTKHL